MTRAWLLIPFFLTLTVEAAGEGLDSLVLKRMFAFRPETQDSLGSFVSNVYMKHLYQTHKRNATLWAIPTMYAIARGKRAFVSEQYGVFKFSEENKLQYKPQVYFTTIPHQRRTMHVLQGYVMPSLYDVTIYGGHVLSPFNAENRMFYRYAVMPLNDTVSVVMFRPRFVSNTQLVRGRASVHQATGHIRQAEMEGEFDMIRFNTSVDMGSEGVRAAMPRQCTTQVEFKFAGNHISSRFVSLFDCPQSLPDTVDVKGDRQLIDSLRPLPLTDEERFIYASYDYRHASADTTAVDTVVDEAVPEHRHHNYLKEIGWDIIGENLLQSIRARSENGYVKLSPIINPQYVSYSKRKGFSYKFKLGARYNFSPAVGLETSPRIGYNFKLREFYWTVPFRLDYSPKMNAYFELVWGNDNRVGSNGVLDEIRQEQGELPELEDKNLDLFDHQYVRFSHNITPLGWLNLEAGFVYHQRHALNATEMRLFDKPTTFCSFAPSVGVKLRPWPKAPLLSVDYERGIRGNNVNMTYERWEADLSQKFQMSRLQKLNVRLGGGLYTRKDKNYFMDFSNFRDENLPEGWDDDWTGNFQLLSSHLYNASDYYLRGNVSYESPLLAVAMVPVAGRYVECERIYLSTLSIAHTRLYSELGYGFTCRFFSMAAFASFLNTRYQEMGCKFTFEL